MANGNQLTGQAKQLNEIFQGLLKLTGQSAKAVGKGAQVAVQASPLAILSQLIGAASVIPEQQKLQQAVQGTQTQQAGQQPTQAPEITDPFLKGAESELKKLGASSIQESSAEIGPEATAQAFQQKLNQQPAIPPVPQFNVGQQQAQQQQPLIRGEGFSNPLEFLFQQAGAFADPQTGQIVQRQGGLFNLQPSPSSVELLNLQKLLGRQPLQEGEQEKITLENAAELNKALQVAGTKGLGPEQAGKFSLLLEGEDAVREVDNILFGGTGTFSSDVRNIKFTPDFFKSDRSRQLQLALETAVDTRTRIETGAALQPEELQREARKLMPRLNESEQTYQKRLRRSFNFFNRALNVADPSGKFREQASGRVGSSAFNDAIDAEIKRRGIK